MFALGTFSAGDGSAFPGLVLEQRALDLRPIFGENATTAEMLEDWDRTLARLREVASDPPHPGLPLDALRPLPVIHPARQLFCAGANYHKHLTEILFSDARRDPDERRSDAALREYAAEAVRAQASSGTPFVFTMPPSAICGAHDDIVLWGPGVEHDWELELAVVIGRDARNVAIEDAMDYVAGYTMSNDISTRDVMNRRDLPLTDFMMTKGRPGFFPTGPYLVPKEFISDYRELRIKLSVNGEVMQDERVDDIIYGVEKLISYASILTELRAGDIFLTGSPGGNAAHHGDRWLRPGDVLEAEITTLGTMRNRCVADPDSALQETTKEQT